MSGQGGETLELILARLLSVVLALLILRLLQGLFRFITRVILRPPLHRLKDPAAEANILLIVQQSITLASWALLFLAIAIIYSDNSALVSACLSIVQSILIIALALGVYRLIRYAFSSQALIKLIFNTEIEGALLPFVRTTLEFFTVFLGIIFILQAWNIGISSLIAALGIGGLVVSLAAQSTLSNYFGFAAIVSDRPFVVGDYIETPEVQGTVENVGLRSTRIRQINQAYVTVPNNMLANSAVINTTQLNKRVCNCTIGIPYTTPVDTVKQALDKARDRLRNDPNVDQDVIYVHLANIGNQSLEVLLRFYVLAPRYADFLRMQEAILFDIVTIFNQAHLPMTSATNTMYVASAAPAGGSEPDASRLLGEDRPR